MGYTIHPVIKPHKADTGRVAAAVQEEGRAVVSPAHFVITIMVTLAAAAAAAAAADKAVLAVLAAAALTEFTEIMPQRGLIL